MTQDKITEYANEIRQDIANSEYADGDYCIIVTTNIGNGLIGSNDRIRNVYKNVNEFEAKALEHMRGIDTMFGIDVITYIFD